MTPGIYMNLTLKNIIMKWLYYKYTYYTYTYIRVVQKYKNIFVELLSSWAIFAIIC